MSNSQDPPLCATGCGFYRNPNQKNLCSKCYNDFLKKTVLQIEQEQKQPPTITTTVDANVTMQTTKKEKKSRCNTCNKKVGLTGFECKCGQVYCGSHRYPEEHSCTFDFKTLQLQGLSKTLYSVAECKADRVHNRI